MKIEKSERYLPKKKKKWNIHDSNYPNVDFDLFNIQSPLFSLRNLNLAIDFSMSCDFLDKWSQFWKIKYPKQ